MVESEVLKDFQKISEMVQQKDQQIAELNQQLIEKDKKIKELKRGLKSKEEFNSELCCDNIKLKQSQNSKAIEELEKVKGKIASHTLELWSCENDDIDFVLYEEIDNQITELRGGENE